MSQPEIAAALAFLLAIGIALAVVPRSPWEAQTVRGLLAANAVVSAFAFAIGEDWSARGGLFLALVALGGSEAGCWVALGLDRVLPVTDPDKRRGHAVQDPWRDGILLAAVIAMFLVMALQDRGADEAAEDAVEIPRGELPPL